MSDREVGFRKLIKMVHLQMYVRMIFLFFLIRILSMEWSEIFVLELLKFLDLERGI